ncbi:GWxTD domain-containing protein [Ekhidna sp.]|uniref:GWxTD domain-containing protein n=1 Tax=Ekhidna sp. TaxID=2608089 RepID=UPI003B50B675
MRKHLLLLSIIALLYGYSANAIDFSRVNLAWQYDLTFSVKMSHRVVKTDAGNVVFLNISSQNINEWEYEFLMQRDYDSEAHRSFSPTAIDTLLSTKSGVLVKISLPETKDNLLVVKFNKPENFYYYDISLKIGFLSFPEVYPVNANGLPILENYFNRSGNSWWGANSMLAMQYAEKFSMAKPPMAEMEPLSPQVDVDSTFAFRNKAEFLENYFYTVRKDSLATTGVTILRVPPYFPEYRQLVELIEAMFYLTSEQEMKAIIKSPNPKEAFDSFWMNTYSTKSRARLAIRKYYNKVEYSNRLFTDFKPGWKTDRGMIFIVFGRPDEVYRSRNSEEWYYDDGDAFEFTIISTFFAPKTYALRRSKALEEVWFNQIAALRRDINE